MAGRRAADAAEPSGSVTSPQAAGASAPPAHLKPTLLQISGAYPPSFNALTTVSVRHSLVLELPVPWAVAARSTLDVWIYSPHVGLAAMPVGPPPPLWLLAGGAPPQPAQWPKAESSGDPTVV